MSLRSRRVRAGLAAVGAIALLAACAPGEVEGDNDDTAAEEPVEVEEFDPADYAGETLN